MTRDDALLDLKVLPVPDANRRQFRWEVRDQAGAVVEAVRQTYARHAEALRAGNAAMGAIRERHPRRPHHWARIRLDDSPDPLA